MTKYQKIGDELASLIGKRVLRSGDRVPSVRSAARKHHVHLGTVVRAYRDLEARGLIESRPRSGYFVRTTAEKLLADPAQFKVVRPMDLKDLIFELFETIRKRSVIQFGSAFVNPDLFPPDLNRAGAAAARGLKPAVILEDLPPGNLELRRLIARRYLDTGSIVAPEDIVITTGALEAISLCLRAVTRPGDTVAIETPAFFATLQMLEWMGLRAAEIATDPREGIDLDALRHAFETGSIKACVVVPTFQNPMGSCMPEERKRDLARLAERYKIPVIEDAAYAELYFGASRPRSVKSFDRVGWVLHCGSLSKCLAPGYRIGWAAPGRFMREVWESKVMTSLTTAPVCQEALLRYFKRGGFEQHLRRLRQTLAERCQEMIRAPVFRTTGELSSDAACRRRYALGRDAKLKLSAILVATLAFAWVLAASAEEKLGKAADNAIYAQTLVNATMAQHPELVVLGMHALKPGAKIETMIAANLDRIGKKDDEDDLAVAHERKTILAPNMKDPRRSCTEDYQRR